MHRPRARHPTTCAQDTDPVDAVACSRAQLDRADLLPPHERAMRGNTPGQIFRQLSIRHRYRRNLSLVVRMNEPGAEVEHMSRAIQKVEMDPNTIRWIVSSLNTSRRGATPRHKNTSARSELQSRTDSLINPIHQMPGLNRSSLWRQSTSFWVRPWPVSSSASGCRAQMTGLSGDRGAGRAGDGVEHRLWRDDAHLGPHHPRCRRRRSFTIIRQTLSWRTSSAS